MSLTDILLIILLIALNAFFVGMEFAIVSSRRARLELLAGSESGSAGLVRKWIESPASRDHMIAASQLGITLVSLALGAVGENAFERWLQPHFANLQMPGWISYLQFLIPLLPLLLSLAIVTSLHVVFGEQVPKVAVLRNPERFALGAAPYMNVFMLIFRGFVTLLDKVTQLILTLFGLEQPVNPRSVYTIDEFKQIVTGPEVEGVFEEPEREMLSAVIDFGDLVVRQLIVPRTEIIAAQAGDTLEKIVDLFLEYSFSKLPVYEEDLDHVTGVLHIRDVLRSLRDDPESGLTAAELAREVIFVPETISVNQLLHEFRRRRMHMAIVLDEFSGTSGLITLEDLLEEIIGDVQDPFETSPPPIQSLNDGSSLVDGMTLIEELNDHFGLSLNDPDYDTVAGYVLGKLRRIAQEGDVVNDREHGLQMKVVRLDGLRIAEIELKHLPEEEPSA